MSRTPWFKFWAADYLCDSDVQKLPLEAQGMLLRMWCACHIDGSLPSDPEELAVLIRCKLKSVLQSYPLCQQFFELRDGRLYSPRMEREKAKSDIARANAQSKNNKDSYAIGSANGSPIGLAKSPAQKARRSEGQNKEQEQAPLSETGTDQTLFDIAKAYPKLSHLNSEMEISPIVLQRLIAAIDADGADRVLQGTKAYAAQLKDREFALAPEKFFGLFEYRAHAEKPANKSPWSGNPCTRLDAELAEPTVLKPISGGREAYNNLMASRKPQ
jgi:uncharacterized protein YdaU (DUF1376 family)